MQTEFHDLAELKQSRRAWWAFLRQPLQSALVQGFAFGILCCGGLFAYVQMYGWPAVGSFVMGPSMYGYLVLYGLLAAVPLALAQVPAYPTLKSVRNLRTMKAAYAEWKAAQLSTD